MQDIWSVLGGCVLTCSCAAGSMLVKGPVEQQCAGYGLRGCPDLVDGVILYVDGDKPGAVHKLKEAAAKNSPEQIRPFAKALKGVLPGEAGAEIALILSGDVGPAPSQEPMRAAHEAPRRTSDAPTATTDTATGRESDADAERKAPPAEVLRTTARLEHVEMALVAPVDPSRLVTESTSPQSGGQLQGACDLAGTNGMCTMRPPGSPLVITDAVTPSACKTELFIGAADLEGKFEWFVQTNSPGFQGSRFLVKSGQWLAFVARGVPTNKALDPRCVVTWAGFRPRIVPQTITPASD
jgi:hypothetical protein